MFRSYPRDNPVLGILTMMKVLIDFAGEYDPGVTAKLQGATGNKIEQL